MLDYIERLTSTYRGKGLLLDTNLLLLLVVGLWSPRRIARFKRTNVFTENDFLILRSYASEFEHVITTPHIATETSNLLGQLPARDSREARILFRDVLNSDLDHRMTELFRSASQLSSHEMFPRFGLADTSLRFLSNESFLVLTDDLPLFHYLGQKGLDVLNYNYLRTEGW